MILTLPKVKNCFAIPCRLQKIGGKEYGKKVKLSMGNIQY